MTTIVYFNGDFVDKDAVRISPDERGWLFGDGVYEVTPSYDGRFFCVDRHLERLRRSLAEVRIMGIDVDALRDVSVELLERNGLARSGRAIVYLQVTRGAAPRAHAFPTPAVPPTVYGYAAPFVPKVDPEQGAAAITVPDIRWARCDIKSVALLPNCLANQEAREADAFEAIFVRDGMALEGTHTNLFAVIGGEVWTAPKTNYVLPGITRGVVLELCAEGRIPACERPVTLQALRRADEIFLAGTTTEVLPVVRLDGAPVGDGRPGAITRALRTLFSDRVARSTR